MILRFLKVLFLATCIFPAFRGTASPAPAPPWWSLDYSPALATLGVAPDWSALDPYQETMSRATFEHLLDTVYASSRQAWRAVITTSPSHAAIVMRAARPAECYLLRFAETDARRPPRFWRPPSALPPPADPAKPLDGLGVALDPGHLGGTWARMEQRFFQFGSDPAVQEGDLTLEVARRLEPRLAALGATVSLIRPEPGPVATLRPADLTAYARDMLRENGLQGEPAPETLQNAATRMFCINAEIRARAALVNEVLRPDLVLALHFNAESWGTAEQPAFAEDNHLHVLAFGCLEPAELAHDDERLEMLVKLLQRTHPVERDLGTAAAAALAAATGLPAFTYHGKNARRVNGSPYLWARNLLASRLYRCPVIYLEPHVMNHPLTYERLMAGPYEGTRVIGGKPRPNIFDEYAEATASGLAKWIARHRKAP